MKIILGSSSPSRKKLLKNTGLEFKVKSPTIDEALQKKEFKGKSGGNIEAASKIGAEIAKKAIDLGHKKVTFDRSGYKYHGRVKALADGARDGGLEF